MDFASTGFVTNRSPYVFCSSSSSQTDRMRNLSFLKCTVVIINMDIALLIYKLDYLCLCECFFFSPWEIVFSEGMSVSMCCLHVHVCAHNRVCVCVCVCVLTLLLCITCMYVCMYVCLACLFP